MRRRIPHAGRSPFWLWTNDLRIGISLAPCPVDPDSVRHPRDEDPLRMGRHTMKKSTSTRDFLPVLQQMVATNASDLHLKVGVSPTLRIDGVLYSIEEDPVMPPDMDRM